MSDKDELELPLCFEEILAASPDAIIVHDLEGRVLFWNKAAESLYGWSGEEIKGRPIGRIFYLDTLERETAARVLHDTGSWSGDLRQLARDGHEYLVNVRQQLHRGAKGEPLAVVSFNRDITEQRKQADAAERAHHIQSSNILAGGIAHELNNALAPIMLSAAMLKRIVTEDKSKSMVSMIEKCATKGADLISDLLAFERGKGGGSDVIRKTDILRAIQRAKGAVVPDSIELDIALADDLWEFHGEADELGKVYRNIIQNACEAMPSGGKLTVEVTNFQCDENFADLAPESQVGAYVRFAFKDNGSGIDESIKARVAEPFFTTKEPKQGYGFGLSISQAIVKGHKGFMVLESAQGGGTSLTVYLPAYAKQSGGESTVQVAEDLPLGEGQLLLVVDDELFIRESMQRALEDRGYGVITAKDGAEALALYTRRQEEIQMVVANVEMPFMDGPALCRALRKLNPRVHILVSSGHKQSDKLMEVRASGVDQFLHKPYTAEQLAERVCNILDV